MVRGIPRPVAHKTGDNFKFNEMNEQFLTGSALDDFVAQFTSGAGAAAPAKFKLTGKVVEGTAECIMFDADGARIGRAGVKRGVLSKCVKLGEDMYGAPAGRGMYFKYDCIQLNSGEFKLSMFDAPAARTKAQVQKELEAAKAAGNKATAKALKAELTSLTV